MMDVGMSDAIKRFIANHGGPRYRYMYWESGFFKVWISGANFGDGIPRETHGQCARSPEGRWAVQSFERDWKLSLEQYADEMVDHLNELYTGSSDGTGDMQAAVERIMRNLAGDMKLTIHWVEEVSGDGFALNGRPASAPGGTCETRKRNGEWRATIYLKREFLDQMWHPGVFNLIVHEIGHAVQARDFGDVFNSYFAGKREKHEHFANAFALAHGFDTVLADDYFPPTDEQVEAVRRVLKPIPAVIWPSCSITFEDEVV